MAFKKTYTDYRSREETRARNQQVRHRRCTNCLHYEYINGLYYCTCERHKGILYRMPGPGVAQEQVCNDYYASPYSRN